jgi:transcriptional regulator with XRE-family HTH domain
VPADPARELASRLRELRTSSWPAHTITQSHIGIALGLSVPTVSSWENRRTPKSPTPGTLHQLATLFAVAPPLIDDKLHVPRENDLDDDAKADRDKLLRQLTELRNRTRTTAHVSTDEEPADLWRFPEGDPIRVICGKLEEPPADGENDALNRIALFNYADLDALVELYGYLRKVNPNSNVEFRRADLLRDDDLQAHLVIIGNLAWAQNVGGTFLPRDIPVKPVHDEMTPEGEVFEVNDGGNTKLFRPELTEDGKVTEDVGLFLRTKTSINQDRTLTICSGVYTRGGYAAVRILTDDNLRQQNQSYITDLAGDATAYGILMRVKTFGPRVPTPDLRDENNRLFTFSLPG